MKNRLGKKYRKIMIVSILFLIAIFHLFRIGNYLTGDYYKIYYSYFSDFILPFGAYLLLCIDANQFKISQNRYVKAGVVFLAATFAEILQAFGVYALGMTFDPLDIVMYGSSVLFAATVEKQLLERYFSYPLNIGWRVIPAVAPRCLRGGVPESHH